MLKEILDSHEKKEFKWGENDCCLFAANVVNEYVGIDYARNFRNTYFSEAEAWNVVDNNLEEFITKLLKVKPRTDFINCTSGNPVSYKFEKGYSIGIAYGDRAYFITGLKKYLKIPLKKCRCYWRII